MTDKPKENTQQTSSPKASGETPPSIPDKSGGLVEVTNAALYYETRDAVTVATKKFHTTEGENWPTADLSTPNKKLMAYAQLKPDPEKVEPFLTDEQLSAWQQRVGGYLLAMDDLTADVMDIVSAVWLGKAEHWESMVAVTADDFLKIRGLQEHKSGTGRRGGYTEEQRKEIALHLAILDNTWITVLAMDIIALEEGKRGLYRKLKKWEGRSRAVVVSSMFGEVSEMEKYGDLKPFVWMVRPGDVFAKFLFGPGRQTALLAQKALQYHPDRQKYLKRYARYLAYQWRIRQSSGNYLHPFLVETLLKAANVEIDEEHPLRTKDHFEQDMDTLAQDKITGSWQYETPFDESMVGQKGWLRNWWMKVKVLLEPPQEIMDQYAKIKNPAPKVKSLPKGVDSLAEQLKQTRLARGLTLMQAAEEIGIHCSRICRIEKGEKPSPETVKKIQKWLGLED